VNTASETAARSMSEAIGRRFTTIPQMFFARVAESGDAEAFRYPVGDSWQSMPWTEADTRVRHIAAGLLALGIQREHRCAILSSTRLEWVLADLGVMCAGGATTTIYPSNTADECAYILTDSATRVVFAEDEAQLGKLREQRHTLADVVKVVTFDGVGDGDWIMSLDELESIGAEHLTRAPDAVDAACAELDAEHLSTLIYTSGTTGRPKGVRLVHDCWAYEGEAVASLGLLGPDDMQYLWLPLAHSFGKVLLAAQLAVGFPTAIDGRVTKLVDNLAVIRPTFMAGAPRIFEKVYNKVIQGAQQGSKLKRKLFHWAVSVGTEVSKLRQQGEEPEGMLATKYRFADRLVFSKLKARFGGRVRFFISGSAPLSREIAEFFHAADILILEGYGLTETSAGSFINLPDSYRFGTVGHALPGTEAMIADADGEVLLRGPGVMRGYHNLPEETAEVLRDDGWLHTGDIGEIDDDGFLRITDRKKDLIKTSGGKYVAPQLIEGRFKAVAPYVSQFVVHGDRRNYCTALVTIDEESITSWADARGLGDRNYEELTQRPEVRDLVQESIDELNANLARYETIKAFAILPRELSIEEGELTPSMKVKRKAVEAKFEHVLDSLYDGESTS
jgi:long-chain acyl-CoA synthetase